jgi:glycosyltransferase involved in cell wall biosynthesis
MQPVAYKSTLDIVVPLFNSEPTIQELMRRVNKLAATELAGIETRMVLVDDGSSDSTWQIINRNAQDFPNVNYKFLRLSRNFGQHPATMAGLLESKSNFVVIMDCDLQDPPELIPQMLELMQKNESDIVYAVAQNSQSFLSKIFHVLNTNKLKSQHLVGTFRLLKRHVVQAGLAYPELSSISGPVLDSLGFSKSFLHYIRPSRDLYGSSYTLGKRLSLGIDYFISRTKFVAMTSFLLSAFILFGTAFYSIIVIWNLTFGDKPLPPGINQIVLMLLITIGILTLGFSILLILLQENLKYAKRNPAFHINEERNYP